MISRTPPRGDAILLTALIWTWGLTGAFFWGLADRLGAVLPQIPTALWAGPGLLWHAAPWALVTVLMLVPVFVTKLFPPFRARRWVLGAAFGVVIVAALVWGGALLRAEGGIAGR